MPETMTSLQRIFTTLGQQEPDRVPLLIPATMHGAKELGLPLKDYYSKAENVVQGQLRLRRKYRSDILAGFLYASLELEAWGGETQFYDDGPPNSGEPIVRKPEDILKLEPPKVSDSPCLLKTLEVLRGIKAEIQDEALIAGVVISPFSLPVMQLGFEAYLDILNERPDLLDHLMRVNETFCVDWANSQFAAGATAVVYFDPVSSVTIVPKEMSLRTGFPSAKRVLAQFKGPVCYHFASGRCLPILDEIKQTGALLAGVSSEEDLGDLKKAAGKGITILGNLNGVEMCRWTAADAERKVKDCIARAGQGGGYILADAHGEIPYQVPDDVLMAISEAVHEWGRYPLDWVSHGAET